MVSTAFGFSLLNSCFKPLTTFSWCRVRPDGCFAVVVLGFAAVVGGAREGFGGFGAAVTVTTGFGLGAGVGGFASRDSIEVD
jgi:hypothetical protein